MDRGDHDFTGEVPHTASGRRRLYFIDVQTERMQIGFIGAGKVGVSLGKYFKEKGRNVGGYYSLTRASAAWAAAFTQTTCYESLEEIISSCGMILFTVFRHRRSVAAGKALCIR